MSKKTRLNPQITRRSALVTWLYHHKYVLSAATKAHQPITHTTFDGLCLSIPDAALSEAKMYMAEGLSLLLANSVGCPRDHNYLSEYRSEVAPWYLDIDLKLPETDGFVAKKIVGYVNTAQTVIRRFFSDAQDLEAVICRARRMGVTPRDAEGFRKTFEGNDKTPIYKYGVHVVFPKVFVSREQAQHLWTALIYQLTETEGSFGPWDAHRDNDFVRSKLDSPLGPNYWYHTIDGAVYSSPGALRPIGSLKMNKCEKCNGKGEIELKTFCVHCAGTGKQSGTWFYAVSVVISSNGEVDIARSRELLADAQKSIDLTSIRTPGACVTAGWKVPSDAPVPLVHSSGKKPTGSTQRSAFPPFSNVWQQMELAIRATDLRKIAEEETQVESHLTNSPETPWSTIRIARIDLQHPETNNPNKPFIKSALSVIQPSHSSFPTYKVFFANPGFCLLAGRQHSNAPIWFLFEYRQGMQQRCLHEACRSKWSPKFLIPDSLHRLLWPQRDTDPNYIEKRNTQFIQKAVAAIATEPAVADLELNPETTREAHHQMNSVRLEYCCMMERFTLAPKGSTK